MSAWRLHREKAALVVVDVQERLVAAMPPDGYARMLNRTVALVKGAQALGLPIVVTEQYKKGLGPTVPELLAVLGEARRFEKLEFSGWLPQISAALAGRDQLLIAGMETHVCVYQTVRDMWSHARLPVLCADAVLSRTAEDKAIGISMCRDIGAKVVSAEAALFDLLRVAGTPEFKLVSAAVK